MKMDDSPELNSIENNTTEDSNASSNSKIIEIHPLAFTIEFNDQKIDEARKSKVHERLSAFTFRHKRNPSLPDFGAVKNAKSSSPTEKLPSPSIPQHVPVLNKGLQKSGKPSEPQWKSSALKAVKNPELRSPIVIRKNFGDVNGVRESFAKHLKHVRRNSLNDIDDRRLSNNVQTSSNVIKNGEEKNDDDKSDTVSEAGTYTVDKEEDSPEADLERTQVLVENEEVEDLSEGKKNYHSSWINDWVRDVEQQNMLHSNQKDSGMHKSSGSGNSSPGASKIPSPIHTINRKGKLRSAKCEFKQPVKLNGASLHRRSSSLSAKDYNDNHGSESSLETESFLRTTESVVTAMQNRMRLNPDPKYSFTKPEFNYQERPHPPSTASDTDTNSESDAKIFKKPIGNPFTSARLNRAFSLRRAKADPEKGKKKGNVTCIENEEKQSGGAGGGLRSTLSPKTVSSKPPSSSFSRLDCGRFSMRSTFSSPKPNLNSQPLKKDVKKTNTGNRSTSSLSSREVEFQNWSRRKSFDPMKSAAEGRKKELAKKNAALNQSMTQSVNVGRSRSGLGNPVLRSASFHSTAQVFGEGEDDQKETQDQGSADEQEESGSSSWLSNRRSLPRSSPTQGCERCSHITRTPIFNSRSSLVSETHSSPSRRLRSDDLDNLVMGAISDLSFKLKMKSCNILKKLHYFYDPNDEKSFRLRDEISLLESRPNSAKNSPIHQGTSRDLAAILKNLKGLENAFNLLDDVLFDENLEIYVNE